MLLALEDRRLLSTITVNTLGDPSTPVAGQTSLREAIAEANPGDTIAFAAGLSGTIQLNPSLGELEPQYQTNLTITGPGADVLTINGEGDTGILSIDFNTTVNISGLTFADGSSIYGYGGAILNQGDMTVTDCTFLDNAAAYYGGGVYNHGSMTVIGSTFSGNTASAGTGGAKWTSFPCRVRPVSSSGVFLDGPSTTTSSIRPTRPR